MIAAKKFTLQVLLIISLPMLFVYAIIYGASKEAPHAPAPGIVTSANNSVASDGQAQGASGGPAYDYQYALVSGDKAAAVDFYIIKAA